MAISRGQFLRSLGASLPGYAVGTAGALATRLLGEAQRLKAPPEVDPATGPAFIRKGPENLARVALTFEGGPVPGVTEELLDLLESQAVTSIFFLSGRQVAAEPALARRVRDAGHEIGSRAYTPTKLTTLPSALVEIELQKANEVLAEILEVKPRWFRPPYGEFRRDQAELAERHGLQVVLWSVATRDWARIDVPEVFARVETQILPGAIIQCHDLTPQTKDLAQLLIEACQSRNLELCNLSKLLMTN